MSNHPPGNEKTELPPFLRLGHLLRHNREELLYIVADPLRSPWIAARRLLGKARGKRHLGYIGWLGHRNLGDEAMFHSIRARLSPFHLTPFAPPPGERMFARIGPGGADFFQGVVLGGGTLINPLFLPAAKLVRSFGIPLHTIGTGVGSPGFGMPAQVSCEGWREILRDSFVSVRGPLSLKRLQDAGLPQAQIVGDPALGLTPDTAPPLRERQRLIVNLSLEPGKRPSADEVTAFRSAASIAKQFSASGGEVVGVALGNADGRALREFRAEYRLSGMRIEYHRRSAGRLLQTIAGSVGLIGVRLHSAVLACCVSVPPLLFAYRDKCEDFMASMNLTHLSVTLSPQASAPRITDQWRQIVSDAALRGLIHQRALYWKEKQQQFCRQLALRLSA